MTAVLTRRSEHQLTEPAPCDQEFHYLLRAAATAPDHGRLQPWRWILLRGAARHALADCLAEEARGTGRDRIAAKVLRAPLLATLVFAPRLGHRVPEWEQLAATSAMAHAMMLLLHGRGFGSIWRTGALADSAQARRLLGLRDGERLLGWLFIGTPVRTGAPRRRPPQDVTGRVTTFTGG
nr:nitroreductase [Streptomyces harenosi]